MINSQMPKLMPGDSIGIVAPARKVTKDDLSPFVDWCKKQGWKVVYGSHLFGEFNQFSGTDLERASDMNELLNNAEVKAIFCARGGYGAARIVDIIQWEVLAKNPKWICGYSDVTVFHSHIQQVLKMPSLHCFMPISLLQYDSNSLEKSLKLTADFLCNGEVSFELPDNFNNINIEADQLIGGNLSVLFSLLGSISLPQNNKNTLLFLEDLDEYLYHIDRMTVGLKRAHFFNQFDAIITGGLTDMKDNTIHFGKSAVEILQNHAIGLNIPIYSNFPAGHIEQNFPIPFGIPVKISNNSISFATV